MASTTCGWCKTLTHMQPTTSMAALPYFDFSDKSIYMGVFQCSSETCHRYSIGYTISRKHTPEPDLLTSELMWEPTLVRRPDFPDVPEEIGQTASEAHACLSIGAARGAVALARAVVEATAKMNNITDGTLIKKIDKMHEEGLIRELTRNTAHAIRLAGNEVAHGDIGQTPIPKEDAQVVVEFMDSLLEEVFQHPAKLTRLQQSTQNRTKPAGT